SIDGKPVEEWQGLEKHLRNAEGTVPDFSPRRIRLSAERTERSVVPALVIARDRVPKQSQQFGAGFESGLSPAKKSVAKFGDEFGSGEWAYLAGLWHGKNNLP
ncbi:MAG: hypothetical protein Q7T83_13515, partial [Thermodesulfovibrionales bacterium]|nr:hypothetical protein [Thermodesulfovibrionales bacterium]